MRACSIRARVFWLLRCSRAHINNHAFAPIGWLRKKKNEKTSRLTFPSGTSVCVRGVDFGKSCIAVEGDDDRLNYFSDRTLVWAPRLFTKIRSTPKVDYKNTVCTDAQLK